MISDMKFFFSEIELFLFSISSRWKYILVKIKACNNSISRKKFFQIYLQIENTEYFKNHFKIFIFVYCLVFA